MIINDILIDLWLPREPWKREISSLRILFENFFRGVLNSLQIRIISIYNIITKLLPRLSKRNVPISFSSKFKSFYFIFVLFFYFYGSGSAPLNSLGPTIHGEAKKAMSMAVASRRRQGCPDSSQGTALLSP